MKKFTLLLCTFVLACASASSQPSTKDAKIEKLLVSMNIDKLVDSMFSQIRATINSQMPADATPEQRAKLAEAQKKMFDLIQSHMSWERMRPQYVKLYSDTFTEEEIDGLVAFYDSPAGKAMLTKMPIVMSKSMAMAQEVMREITPQIQQITKESLAPAK